MSSLSGSQYHPMEQLTTFTVPTKDLDKSNRKINLKKAIELYVKGNSYADIGKYFNVTRSAVWELLKRHMPHQADFINYKNNEESMMIGKQAMIWKTLDLTSIKKMCPRDRFMAWGLIQDKRQAMTGTAGSININIVNILQKGLAKSETLAVSKKDETVIDAEFIQSDQ